MPCGEGIWGRTNGDSAACEYDNRRPPAMSEADAKLWQCSDNGDISLDLRGVADARKCLSFSTEGSCEFRQKDLRGLQVNLESSGCDGLWAAPLWMVPSHWEPPQHMTGEIDVFERGCDTKDGYLLSLGENSTWILNDAWGEQGKPGAATKLTAYLQFDPVADRIAVYKCPFGSTPMRDGPDAAQCSLSKVWDRYYKDTRERTNLGEDYLHLVSDVWNEEKGHDYACVRASKGGAQKHTDCHFKVSGIHMQFSEESTAAGKSPFKDGNAQCNPLHFKGVTPKS